MGSEKRTVRLTMPDVIKIIVESGALYLVTQLIFVVLFAIKHPAQAIVAVMAVQIYVCIQMYSVHALGHLLMLSLQMLSRVSHPP